MATISEKLSSFANSASASIETSMHKGLDLVGAKLLNESGKKLAAAFATLEWTKVVYYGVASLKTKEVKEFFSELSNVNKRCKMGSIALAVTFFVLSEQFLFVAPFCRVASLASLVAAYDFHLIESNLTILKYHLEQRCKNDTMLLFSNGFNDANFYDLFNFVTECCKKDLILLNSPFFFRKKICYTPALFNSHFNVAKTGLEKDKGGSIEWIPATHQKKDSCENLVTQIKANIQDKGTYRGSLEEGLLRPLSSARTAAIGSSFALYLLSSYLPLGWLTLGGSVTMAYLAYEIQQVYELVRSNFSGADNAKIQEDTSRFVIGVKQKTWLLQKDFFLGKDLEALPSFVKNLEDASFDFNDQSVKWEHKSLVTTIYNLVKGWEVDVPDWYKFPEPKAPPPPA